jgi:hypothetical protein
MPCDWTNQMLHAAQKRASERARNAMRGGKQRRERHHHHQPTLERRPTVKRQILVRLIVMHFFCVLFILVMSCPFLLFLSLSHLRACLSLTSPSPVRYSRLTLCLSLSLHTRTRSVYKDITRRKKRTEERERRASSLTVISPTNIRTHIALTTKTTITLFEYMCAKYVTHTHVSISHINI